VRPASARTKRPAGAERERERGDQTGERTGGGVTRGRGRRRGLARTAGACQRGCAAARPAGKRPPAVHVRAVAPGWPCLLRSCIAGQRKAEVAVEGETDARGVEDVAAAPGGGGEEGGISGAGDVFFFSYFDSITFHRSERAEPRGWSHRRAVSSREIDAHTRTTPRGCTGFVNSSKCAGSTRILGAL